MNPYLPLSETVPDGEPHLFNGRIYIYGSHDREGGEMYCPDDYVLYSCDKNDLSNWRYDGIIYRKVQDPLSCNGERKLYAPDVVQGNDGRYYLYYALETVDAISVAVASQPEGPFEYYGTVRYPAGVIREKLADYPSSFDPAVLNDNGRIFLAFGFSVDFRIEGMALNDLNTRGAYIMELQDDMLTMKTMPVMTIPGYKWGKGTEFEGHEFLEASSLRHYGDTYYFVYSSQKQHELCYATAKDPYGPYHYQGVLVSNAYENGLRNNWANNHGGLLEVDGSYYIFYHRHTCGTQFSRQGCAERIEMADGLFYQADISCGGLTGEMECGEYAGGYACYVADKPEGIFLGFNPKPIDKAYIRNEKIVNITNTTVCYRYFKKVQRISLYLTGQMDGTVTLKVNGEMLEKKHLVECTVFEIEKMHADLTFVFESVYPVTLEKIRVQ